MYEEVKAFIAARDAANEKRTAAGAVNSKLCAEARDESGDCPGCVANRQAWKEANAATLAVWQQLKASADPLVRWIAENCGDCRWDAALILEALPAPMETLDAIAEEQGWCSEYNDLRRRAERAGVLPVAADTAVSA